MMAGRHAFENRIDRRKSREKTLLLSLKIDPKTKTREGVSIAGISEFNQSSNPFYGTICVKLFQELTLFQKAKSTINEDILNIYKEGELEKETSMRKIGNSDFSTKPTNFYNLDVIISVGYRVKSLQGTKFRQWATARSTSGKPASFESIELKK